ncbi:hypothetical protein [Halorubrum sp. FL23]|uniref:hypothetical protein n=1 Tax=Halorubrum sp. FL23 TaxID=3458704 RepID=UPI0040338343
MAQIYRHSDGYPRSVLSSLEHLQELLHDTGTQRDLSYTAAQFLLIDKLRHIGHTIESESDTYSDWPDTVAGILNPESWKNIDATPSYLLGHGVEDPSRGIHGDEEYIYIVQLPTRDPFEEPDDWNIKISEHRGFPRWEDDTEQAFEVAEWQFEGTLERAIERFGSDD